MAYVLKSPIMVMVITTLPLPFHVNPFLSPLSFSLLNYKYHQSHSSSPHKWTCIYNSFSLLTCHLLLIQTLSMADSNFNLPPGFRFYPTDEELVVHFLHRKAALLPCHPDVIPDLELYPYDPWDLDGKAMGEGKKWYFYSRRTQNRITGSGYWQTIGVEEPIYSSNGKKIGTKKYCAFYINEGVKTNWIMHEYRVSNSTSTRRKNSKIDYSKWVLCRVYECDDDDDGDDGIELSCLDEVFLSMDDLDEISLPN